MKSIVAPFLGIVLSIAFPLASVAVEYTVETFERPATYETNAFWINDAGVVAGTAFTVDGYYHQFYRTADGVFHDIPEIGWQAFFATEANDQLEIVGTALPSGQAWPEWGILHINGTFDVLDLDAVANVQWVGITGEGQVFGTRRYDGPLTELFLAEADGSFSFHRQPGFEFLDAFGANNVGQIVGVSGTPGGGEHGFIFDVYTNEFTAVTYPGASQVKLLAINDHGLALGRVDSFPGTYFLRHPDGAVEPLDLTAISEWSYILSDINNHGQLVGRYMNMFTGQTGFIATPVPEPGSGALLFVVLGAVPLFLKHRGISRTCRE